MRRGVEERGTAEEETNGKEEHGRKEAENNITTNRKGRAEEKRKVDKMIIG